MESLYLSEPIKSSQLLTFFIIIFFYLSVYTHIEIKSSVRSQYIKGSKNLKVIRWIWNNLDITTNRRWISRFMYPNVRHLSSHEFPNDAIADSFSSSRNEERNAMVSLMWHPSPFSPFSAKEGNRGRVHLRICPPASLGKYGV